MDKLSKMIRFLPSLYSPDTNPIVRGVLYAWATEDDGLVAAVQDAKDQIFVETAKLQYLDSLGSNVGVYRPTEFNLTDEKFSKLIPYLSFTPKQVVPTINKILSVFYGENNPKVKVYETNKNEIVVQIPSSVPALRRDLKGAIHFHAYMGNIVSVDNVAKEMVINLVDSTKTLVLDELKDAVFGQGLNAETISSNTAGNSGVTLQFYATADLSVFSTAQRFNLSLPKYMGSYFADTTKPYTVTSQRGIVGQVIEIGDIVTSLNMTDASHIPDEVGKVIINFGFGEEVVKYLGRPNNTTLLLDPSYIFTKRHEIGSPVNVVVSPYHIPRTSGDDYSVYLVGVVAARLLAQSIVESIVAAGVVIRWIVTDPVCNV